MNREELLIELTKELNRWPNTECILTDGWAFHDGKYVNMTQDTITIDDWNRAKIVPNTKIRILSPEHESYIKTLLDIDMIFAVTDVYDNKMFIYIDCLNSKLAKEIFIELPVKKYRRTVADINARVLTEKVGSKHNHYFKDVSNLDTIDVYRICDLCEVDDKSGATQHAVKKLLCAGQRGAKDKRKDLEEARDTIIRKLQMMDEDVE